MNRIVRLRRARVATCLAALAVVGGAAGTSLLPASHDAAEAQDGAATVLGGKVISKWTLAGMNNDDAILGKDGTAHPHCYFGTVAAFGDSAKDLLDKPTTALMRDNHSAYWVPAIRMPNGDLICPTSMTGYYGAASFNPEEIAGGFVQPPIFNLGIITGDQNATTRAANIANNPTFVFRCPGVATTLSAAPTSCPDGGGKFAIESLGTRPCWDGETLRAPDGRSHTANRIRVNPDTTADGYTCPASHPVAIPQTQLAWWFDLGDRLDEDWDLVCNEHTPGGFAGAQKGACWHSDTLWTWTDSGLEITKCFNDARRGVTSTLCKGVTVPPGSPQTGSTDADIHREARDGDDWMLPITTG